MKTIQMTLDEDLVTTVDRMVKSLHTTRSAFTREALRQAIRNARIAALEERHRRGYLKRPAAPKEFAAWTTEQKWGDE